MVEQKLERKYTDFLPALEDLAHFFVSSSIGIHQPSSIQDFLPMHKEKKEKHFIQKPQYPGGVKAIRAFIREQLQYPREALEARVEGTVILHYSVDFRGTVTDVRVVSGLGYGCDQEAVRLVQLLKFEVPKTRKLRVKFQKTIQIHFRLPSAPEIQYNYQVGQKPTEEETGSSSYFYTIEWD